jgi:hypothetical protein
MTTDVVTAIHKRLMVAMSAGLLIILASYLALVIYPMWSAGLYRLTDQQIRSGPWTVPLYPIPPWQSPLFVLVVPVQGAKTILAPWLWLLLSLALGSGWRYYSVRERLAWCGVLLFGAWMIFGTGDFARAFWVWIDF